MGNRCFMAAFFTWSMRRWLVAVAVAAATYLFFGLTTAVLANPIFGRSIAPTPWSGNVLVATAILSGLLSATYVRNDGPAPIRLEAVDVNPGERTARAGMLGSLLAYLAIGCPVCNKLALILLGTTGAVNVFAPIQPYLGAIGLALLAVALVVRLRGEVSCATLALRTSGSSGDALTTEDLLARLSAQQSAPGTSPDAEEPNRS